VRHGEGAVVRREVHMTGMRKTPEDVACEQLERDLRLEQAARRQAHEKIATLEAHLATARGEGYAEAREQAATRLETRDVVLPLDDWRGTKKDFSAKLARALAADIRAMQPEVKP
jgi:hypothetical protein